MDYLTLDTIDINYNLYPEELKCISITIRGTKNLFDIFFSATDIETGFNISLPAHIDFTWVNTSSGKEKYLSYPTIKKVLFRIKDSHELVEPYLNWIDSLLFSDSKHKPFFQTSVSSIPSVSETIDDTISDLNDASSVDSLESIPDNKYLIKALQHKVNQLEHQLELKQKDIEILNRDIRIRDKDIELFQLKITLSTRASWI